MDNVFNWLPVDGMSRLLCDALWQSALLAAIGLLAARFVLRQPAARAWLLLLCASGCLLAPLASAAARYQRVTWINSSIAPAVESAELATVPAIDELVLEASVDSAALAAVETAIPQPATNRWSVFLATVWAAASALLAGRLALGMFAASRLIRRAHACDDAKLNAAAHAAAVRVGLPTEPVLRVSTEIRTPTVLAFGRPRLCVPVDAIRSDADIDWAAAFTHELAHVMRGDGWTRLWVELILVAIPLQPLLWWLRKSFHAACEEACDDWAVACGSDPVQLATTLTAWLEANGRLSSPMAVGMSSSRSRVLRLLAQSKTPQPKLRRISRWVAVGASLLLVAGLATAQAPKEPKAEPGATAQEDKPVDAEEADAEAAKLLDQPYRIEPPDVLLVSMEPATPRQELKIAPLDKLVVEVIGTIPEQPITGPRLVTLEGNLVLGASYGMVRVSGLTRAEAEKAVVKHLKTILRNPEVSVNFETTRFLQGINGEHLVTPDGTVRLRHFGSVRVNGLTLDEAGTAIAKHLDKYFVDPIVSVDVLGYNSKVYYVITKSSARGGKGDFVIRVPCTGNETVLDALVQIEDQSGLQSAIIRILRPRPGSGQKRDLVLNVNWDDITTHPDSKTNFRLLPGDRIVIEGPQPPPPGTFEKHPPSYGPTPYGPTPYPR